MDEIKVVWTQIAILQRDNIFNYGNTRNKSNFYSKRINKLLYKKTDLLKLNPEAGIEIEDFDGRILHFEKYGLVYRRSNSQILILAFWDTRQNPLKLRKILGL